MRALNAFVNYVDVLTRDKDRFFRIYVKSSLVSTLMAAMCDNRRTAWIPVCYTAGCGSVKVYGSTKVASKTANASLGTTAEELHARVTEIQINPLNPELNPICYLLALLGAYHFLHVSRIRVKLLTFRLLMSYIYGAPILDVSRSHTTTQHSR